MPYKMSFDGSDGEYPLVPDGDYAAYIHSMEEKSGQSGTYLSVRFVLSEDNAQYKGRTFFTNCFLEGPASFKTQQLLTAAGLHKRGTKEEVTFTPEQLIGKKVTIRLSKRVYEGEEQNDVKSIFPFRAPSQAAAASSGAVPAKTVRL